MSPAEFDNVIKQIIQIAEGNSDIDALYLYGSHAKGEAHEASDIDLAVIFANKEEDPLQRRLRPEMLALDWVNTLGLTEGQLSVLDMESSNIPLTMSVLQTGKLLLNKDIGHEMMVSGKIMSQWELDYQYHYDKFG